MGRKARITALFIVAGSALFAVASAATAFAMIRTIRWTLVNCGHHSPMCSSADLLISYWWLLFVPFVLFVTYLLHRIYVKRVRELD